MLRKKKYHTAFIPFFEGQTAKLKKLKSDLLVYLIFITK